MRSKIIDNAIAASQRRQKRIGDDSTLAQLGALMDAEGGEIILSRQYHIKIVRSPEPAPANQRPLTLAEEREIWRGLAIGAKS